MGKKTAGHLKSNEKREREQQKTNEQTMGSQRAVMKNIAKTCEMDLFSFRLSIYMAILPLHHNNNNEDSLCDIAEWILSCRRSGTDIM